MLILLSSIVLYGCERKNELIIIYENSSDFAMKLQVTLNGEVIDTIQIDKFKTQKTQKSIRKSYQLNEESKFDFKELNTGISISKKINSQNEFKCFILIGQNGSGSITFDTISKKDIPENI
jgi:mannose/fructose/N-acetylgalactosamine-specific phosphotransferase system component IIB